MRSTSPASSSGRSAPWRDDMVQRRVPVRLGARSYDVLIGAGVRSALASVIGKLGAGRAVVVSARPPEWVPDTGVPTAFVPAQDGEPAKTLGTVEALCREFARFGLSRDDV